MHTNTANYGSLIKGLRLQRNMSLYDLSKLAGISASYLHLLETGSRNNPTIGIVIKLNKILGISMLEVEKFFI